MLPTIINNSERIDLFLDGFNQGYNEPITDDSIDIHIQLSKLAAKACVWFVYMPFAFLTAYSIIGTECYDWQVSFSGEIDESFVIYAPILYALEFADKQPDYRTLQSWCKSVYLPAKGKFDELYKSWLRFCRYGIDNNALWNGKTQPSIK